MNSIDSFRNFLKDTIRKTIDFRATDQHRGLPMPPMQSEISDDDLLISLPAPAEFRSVLKKTDLQSLIGQRQSVRRFLDTSLSTAELSWLLWATQGVRNPSDGAPFLRTVPSAGARHSFNTYLIINRVETLPQGLYRYLPLDHALVYIKKLDAVERTLTAATLGQRFIASGAVVFVWATVPYRMEWRYDLAAHRVILSDAGHICQNLYLACEEIGCGTCAIAAYDQEGMDAILNVDGEEEFTVYLAPVGKYNR